MFYSPKRMLALALAVVMTVTSVGTSAHAYEAEKTDYLSVTDKDGKEILEDESWEEKFPNGTFAFKYDSITLKEKEDQKTKKITIYRLGGTKGKATAKVAVAPAVVALDEEETDLVYANAASNTDYTIQVENPIGTDGTIGKKELESSYDVKSETKEDNVVLSLDGVKGEYVRYFWHVKTEDEWKPVTSEGEETLTVSTEEFAAGEYMCVVEADYELSVSKSASAKERDTEGKEKVWVNVNSRHITNDAAYEKNTYTDVTMDAAMPYKTTFLQVDFEEGEWVKDIVVKPTDDEEHEAEEMASFTIYDVEGAAFTETANRFSMCISDDEEVLDSTMGFSVKEVRVDKSTGKVKVKVKRTGALQYVTSVDYETVDGTAKAGTDYAKAKASLGFSGGIDTGEIEIDLLDDKKKTDEDTYFTIRLKNAKGGNLKKGADEIRVNLFNTDTSSKDNVATASKSKEAKDATSRVKESKKAITESDNEVKVEAVEKENTELKLDSMEPEEGDMAAQEDANFHYNLNVSGAYSSWGDTVKVSDAGSFYKVDGNSRVSSATAGSVLLDTKRRDNSYFYIPNLCNRYDKLTGNLYFQTNYALYWAREYYSGVMMALGTESFANTISDYTSTSGENAMENAINSQKGKATYNIYDQYDDNDKSRSISVDLNSISNTGSADYLVFKSFVTKRGKTIRDRHTKVSVQSDLTLRRRALSKDIKINVNTPDSDRLTSISQKNNTIGSETKALIKGIQPSISLQSGGYNSKKKWYMGSDLLVKTSGTNGVYKLDKISLKADGKQVYTRTLSNGKTNVQLQNGSSRMSTSAQYSIDFDYNRYQQIQINCATSMLDVDTADDRMDKMNLIKKNIKVNGSSASWSSNTSTYMHTIHSYKNFNTINFGLGEGTKILYNDKVYEGSDTITISDADMDSAVLSFSVYTADAVSVVRDPEILGEKKVSLFEDKNNDGKYTAAADGYEPFLVLDAGQSYDITNFRKRNGNNVVIHVEYSMQPASLNVPPGATGNETFTVVPGFVTTLTTEEEKAKLSKEMKGYRDIASKDGTAPMYGRVSGGSVSFLAGNDNSPARMNEQTEAYEWTPDWDGNLRANFDNPEKIKVYETKMPNGFVAASTKAQINEYLGCIHGNDTYVLTSRVNGTTGEKITATQKGGFYTVPEPPAMAFESDPTGEAAAPSDNTGTTSDQPDVAKTSPSVDMPKINIGLGHGSFFMEGDEIGFSIGTQIFGYDRATDGANGTSVLGSSAMKDMKDAMTSKDDNIFKQLRKAGSKDTYSNNKKGSAGSATSMKDKQKHGKGSGSIDFAVNMSFIWKYSKLTGHFEFSSAMIALSIEGSLRFQYRFQVCPIFYVYVQVGLGLEAQTGLEMEKKEVQKEDGTTTIKNEVSFAGISLNPSAYVEAGAGVGVELAKLEIFVKVSVSFAFTLGEESQVDEFITDAAVGFRAVFLFFSYEMDLIGCRAGYDASRKDEGKKPWFFSWRVVGIDMGGTEGDDIDSEVDGAGVTVSKPKNRYRLQNIYSSDDNAESDMSALAYDVEGIEEFQVSGYGNNTSAVELASGFDNASDFQLLTVGETNYVLYTISRKNPSHSIHTTQLVMSKLSTTASVPEGGDLEAQEVMGLVNPIDENAATKYIVVDRVGGAADATGDLDYDAVVDGNKIKVTWTSYMENAADDIPESMDSQSMLQKASQKLQVKTAEFDAENPAEFTEAKALTTEGAFNFLPKSGTSDVHFFADTKAYSEEEMAERETGYQEKYEQDAEGNEADGEEGTGDPYAKANYEYALTTDYLYGKYSRLYYSVKQPDGLYDTQNVELTDEWKEQGTRLNDVQVIKGSDDNYFIAYTTDQKNTYGEENEYATVKKLYIQEATVETVEVETAAAESADVETTTVERREMDLKQPVLLKTLVDFEDSDEKDGEYVGGALTTPMESPNFTDLKFLEGKLSSDSDKEIFMLYNMNSTTYVIDQKNIKDALGSDEATINVKPLFEVDTEDGSMQAEATIGVDGDGNISAVFTQTVPNTVNNALYVTKYDPTTQGFGEAFMLAMNKMQVYEDCISQNLSPEDTRKAFFQKQEDGKVDKFIFNSPQIALGKPTTENESGTLTILTKGTLTKLVETTYELGGESRTEFVPDTSDGSMDGNAGIYAISYGVGKQKIGETSITFEKNNFVKNATLNGNVSFRNTGDVAIRASEANPATVTMKVQTDSGVYELAQWELKGNVLAGQQVVTDKIETNPLPADVSTGVIFFEIQEDPDYSDAPKISSIEEEEGTGKITVGEKAELSIDELEIRTGDTIEQRTVNGVPCAVADVEMSVSNLGVKNASNVTFAIKRSSGMTADNEEKYVPLEVQGDFVLGENDEVLIGNGNEEGVFDFLSYWDETDGAVVANKIIPAGTTRTIKGRVMIPLTAFDSEDASGAANIHMTIQCDGEEYESRNNTATSRFVPTTRFDCLDNVSLTVGNPVSFKVNLQKAMDITRRSNIMLTEMKVSSNGELVEATDKLLANAAYNTRTGHATITAAKEGSGILRIADTATSSFKDIAFVSTMSGCNIHTDSPVYEFLKKADGGVTWENKDVGTVHEGTILPENSDICIGKEGGSFTFTTYARSIDLYFDGKVRVSSINSFGFTAREYNSSDGVEDGHYFKRQTIDFGNTQLKKHTVTVKVLSGTASFDHMVEYYADRSEGVSNLDILVDETAPRIFLGKSLPDEGTRLKPGTLLEIPVYVYDDVMLNSISINGSGAEENESNQFAKGTLRIKKNGVYHVIVQDSSGNISQKQVEITCYEEGAEKVQDATDTWPKVDLKLVDDKDQEITTATNSNAYFGYEIQAEHKVESIEVSKVDMETTDVTAIGDPVEVEADVEELSGTYPVNLMSNGYYEVKVTDKIGNVTKVIYNVDMLSRGQVVTLYVADHEKNEMFYCVGDEDNEIALKKMVIYKGVVEADEYDQDLNVAGKEPLFTKTYDDETMDSETITLDKKIGHSKFTIIASDVSGKVTHYVYSDGTCLDNLVVGNAEDLGYGLQINEEFKPYQREYEVFLPYGYPLDRVPEVNVVAKENAQVSKVWNEDVLTLTVKSGRVENTYTITLNREICTCDMVLDVDESTIIVPKESGHAAEEIRARADVVQCEVHGKHLVENITYAYEIETAGYEIPLYETAGIETELLESARPEYNFGENVDVETVTVETVTAETVTIETVQVDTPSSTVTIGEDTVIRLTGNTLDASRIPEGTNQVFVRVKVTATSPSMKAHRYVTYRISNQYDVGLYLTPGGQVTCGEDTMMAMEGNEGSQEELEKEGVLLQDPDEPIRYDLDTGSELLLCAQEKEGYEFVGWFNADEEKLSANKEILYIVGKDASIRALFKDVVKPTGSITLTDKTGTNNVMTSDEGDILVSAEGFTAEIKAEDAHSGVQSVQYQIVKRGETYDPAGEWKTYGLTPLDLTEEMDFVMYVKIVDKDGNETIVQSERTMIEKSFAGIDAAPNFTEGVFTNRKDAAIMVLVKKGIAAIREITYKVGEETYTSEEMTFGVENLPDGVYDVTIQVTDVFGKTVETVVPVKKDTENPVLTITGVPETETVEEAVLGIEADGGLSGVKEVRVNGETWAEDTYTVTENGTYVFELENNAGTAVAETVNIDKILIPTPAPTPTVAPALEPTTPPTANAGVGEMPNGATGVTTASPAENVIPDITEIKVPAKMTVGKGTSEAISAQVLPAGSEANGLTYESTKKSVATVSAQGVITGKKFGKTEIIVRSKKNSNVKAKIAVTVVLPVTKEIRLESLGKKGARVTWKGVKEAVAYKVYRSTKSNGTYKLVAKVKQSVYTSKKKDADKYYYKVVAVAKNKKYNSDYSAYTAKVQLPPAAAGVSADVTKVKAEKLAGKVKKVKAKAKKGKIVVSWKKFKNAKSYVVYRAESQYGIFDEYKVVKTAKLKDTCVVKGKKYYYKVRAITYKNGERKLISDITKQIHAKAR